MPGSGETSDGVETIGDGGGAACPRCGQAAVTPDGDCLRCGVDAARYRAYLAAVTVPPPLPALPPALPPGPPPAGLWLRARAFALDYAGILLARWAWSGGVGLAWDADVETSRVFAAAVSAFPLACGGAYVVISHWLWGQTLGKMALGIRVERLDGGRPGLPALAVRLLVIAVGLGLPVLTGAARADRRGLHDLLAGTRVVQVGPEADAILPSRAAAPAAP